MKKQNKEIYKTIEGYPDYAISNTGNVKSKERKIIVNRKYGPIEQNVKELILKQDITHDGYARVRLYKDKIGKHESVHQLVAKHFIGNKPKNKQTCHKDGNSLNNNVSNLEYKTCKENQQDKKRHGTSLKGEKNHRAKFTNKEILEIKEELKIKKSKQIIIERNINKCTLSAIKTGRNWKDIE